MYVGSRATKPRSQNNERHLPKEPVIDHGDERNLPVGERRAEVGVWIEVRRKEGRRGNSSWGDHQVDAEGTAGPRGFCFQC